MSDAFVYYVAKQFSRFPGGRKRENGPFSGQEFWETVTLPLLSGHELVKFDLTGGAAYSSGFLDEAFGEIGRLIGLQAARRRVTIVADDDKLAVDTAWRRIKEASEEAKKP